MVHKFLFKTVILNIIFSLSQIPLVEGDLFQFPVRQPSGKDITEKVFKTLDNQEVYPVAYGDFNADKLTDVITVNRNRTAIHIFLAHKDVPYMRPGPQWLFNDIHDVEIVAVTPGDFTGDGLMDFMVSLRKNQTFSNDNVTIICENSNSNSTIPWHYPNSNVTTVSLSVIELIFCIGNSQEINCSAKGQKIEQYQNLVQEPMVLDLNEDMILDLAGEIWNTALINLTNHHNETCNFTQMPIFYKTRTIWISEEGRPAISINKFRVENNSTVVSDFELAYPSSNAFVDVDGDLIPELVLFTRTESQFFWNGTKTPLESSISYRREIYQVDNGEGKQNSHVKFQLKSVLTVDPDNQTMIIGQPLFIDLERNGHLLHIFPFCSNLRCNHINGIKVIREGKVLELPLGPLIHDGLLWDFIPPQHQPEINETEKNFSMEQFYSAALTLRAGDYNLDGYPDLIGALKTQSQGATARRTKAVIFENVPCIPTSGRPCELSRTFNPNFLFLDEFENVISASFFDIQENGMADVFLVQQSGIAVTDEIDQTFEIRAFKNSPNFDSYFMKVMVLTGRPCPNCPDNGTPYGSLIPGALMKYKMRGQDGQDQTAISSQMYRSAHMSMDLPYAIFGIGHSPNFVELFNVSIAYNDKRKYVRSSHQIVPNSHIIVIPSPISSPSQWKVKLFLTPSDAVGQTFGVLIGILLVVGVIAAGLEYREKKEDRRDRMAEAHRFMM